jgi:hypothetical protein
VLPPDAEPEPEIVADLPGYYRELGGEQDTTELGYTWRLPENIAYYKHYFHDPPDIGTRALSRRAVTTQTGDS